MPTFDLKLALLRYLYGGLTGMLVSVVPSIRKGDPLDILDALLVGVSAAMVVDLHSFKQAQKAAKESNES